MKVHPAPNNRSITLRYDVASAHHCRRKNLRRLPHIFAKVLELPFHSDADVFIEETPNHFRFVVNADGIGDEIRAHAVEIYPGVTKVVVRGSDFVDLTVDELELDMWRFRLPAKTRPELATAEYDGGELVVMVPKDVDFDGLDVDDEVVWGEGNSGGRLVFVQ